MKKLFYFLLKKYSGNEKNRLEIYKFLHERVSDQYSEQTVFGNIYNAHTEFILSHEGIQKLVRENERMSLDMVKNGLTNAYDKSLKYIEDEKIGYQKK